LGYFLAKSDKIWVSEALQFFATFYYELTDDTTFYGTETAVAMIFKLLYDTISNRILAKQAFRILPTIATLLFRIIIPQNTRCRCSAFCILHAAVRSYYKVSGNRPAASREWPERGLK